LSNARRSDFSVIVVGAGHAGLEACLATSGLGHSTLLVTTNLDRVGYMSCNPSIGGLAKGHMVREIDVLGGEMGFASDSTCIQYKRLNSGKGPAVRGTRMQNDKVLYSRHMSQRVANQSNLTLRQGEVKSLLLEQGTCRGVVLQDGSEVWSDVVIITAGTFLNGVMHMGPVQIPGGRVGDAAAVGLSNQLREFGFDVRRLKTGTPARLHRDSIDWAQTKPQYGDPEFFAFSLRSQGPPRLPQVACFLSQTSPETHAIIRENLHLSPMYAGIIEGVGPRYCPSIEDKVVRFSERDSHQTFLEPESLSTPSIYLQGISTSLPEAVQDQFLRTIAGLKDVRVLRYGYAVEYDFIEPTQIWHRLETRPVKRLFLAGQINGTSGYEEAAAQGLIAGLNASLLLRDQSEFVLGREQAYIGVLIDDLVTKGTREPYRMFTSRAEHRLVLREDNTLERLSDAADALGLAQPESKARRLALRSQQDLMRQRLRENKIFPTAAVQTQLAALPTKPLLKALTFEEFLRRPEIHFGALADFGFAVDSDPLVSEPVEIEVKYAGYIRRQQELINQSRRLEGQVLPLDLRYALIKGLSREEIEKLERVRPRTLGQASRISGVNPSATQAIMIFLRGHLQPQEFDREPMGSSPGR